MSKQQIWRATSDQTELSLTLSSSIYISAEKAASISSSEYSNGNSTNKRKRKHVWDEPRRQRSIELHLDDPLPPDWEQCLDLQSGKMYYLNRKTLKKRWMKPTKEQELDLNLNISYTTFSNSEEKLGCGSGERAEKNIQSNSSDRSCGMITAVCINCHHLVMLCELSPSCPNCKHIHSPLPSLPLASTSSPEAVAVESLKTLSLLHALDVSLKRE